MVIETVDDVVVVKWNQEKFVLSANMHACTKDSMLQMIIIISCPISQHACVEQRVLVAC